jgi:ABC-2 type transport system ATP-binding protein
MATAIIHTKQLRKTFPGRGDQKTVNAVDGVNITVHQGEIFGFLGPNGAGKTTTLQMLTTLLKPTAGEAQIAGYDLQAEPEKIRRVIGYVSQVGGADSSANAYENLILHARLYGMSHHEAQARATSLIERFAMQEFASRQVATYSGGQRRRLDLALGLVHKPRIIFLDEPTLGLDPQSRAYLWQEIRRINQEGATVFITTHYLDEADALCSRLAIIDHGTIVAEGDPATLKQSVGHETIALSFFDAQTAERALQALQHTALAQQSVLKEETVHISAPSSDQKTLLQALNILDANHLPLKNLQVHTPSLDDLFLHKTGRSLREA